MSHVAGGSPVTGGDHFGSGAIPPGGIGATGGNSATGRAIAIGGARQPAIDVGTQLDASQDAASSPEAVASRQSVTFQMKNDNASTLYVTTHGADCDLFRIDAWRNGTCETLYLSFTSQPSYCLCPNWECDYPQGHVSSYVSSESGNTTTLSWDARALVLWQIPVGCGPGINALHDDTTGVRQPVEPGHFRVTFGFDSGIPSTCDVDDTTRAISCYANWGGTIGVAGFCRTSHVVSAEFDLPQSGDVVVAPYGAITRLTANYAAVSQNTMERHSARRSPVLASAPVKNGSKEKMKEPLDARIRGKSPVR